jgi:HD-GYP domain-containing protein (c-di-GMP phosphodiesterase class II)
MATKSTPVIEVKISVSRLKEGMFVCRLDKPWVESSFVFQGFLVNSDALIKKVKEECSHVYIDENRGLAAEKTLAEIGSKEEPKPKKSFLDKLLGRKATYIRKNTNQLRDIVDRNIDTEAIKSPAKLASFDEEMDAAKQAHNVASTLIKDFMSHVKHGGVVDIIMAKHAVYDCISSILRSPDAMMLLIRLKSKDYSLWQHSMNVSALAISLGRYLNLHDDELMLLGLSGMFHDIGKLRISSTLLENAKTPKELTGILNSHTTVGRDILLDCMGQLAEVAAQVAYSHHEYLDGSGFPRGLQGAQISDYTRMISIVNIYDNLTSNRVGKKALTHYDAMTVLLDKAGSQLDATLVDSFNRCIGTYPVGCVVEMSSGEIAMVVEENLDQRLRPKVLLLTNHEKVKIPKKVVNLADSEFTSADESYFIKAIVDADAYGIKL